MRTTSDKELRRDEGHLSLWSIGIGGIAFLTMFFNTGSVLGVLALIPGVKAIRAGAPRRWLAVVGMVLGVLATLGVVSWLVAGGE